MSTSRTQVARAIGALIVSPTPPTITSAPVMNAAAAGVGASWATGPATGSPVLLNTFVLYKNNAIVQSPATSGTYTNFVAGDVLYVVQTTTNGILPNAVSTSAKVTATAGNGLPVWVNQSPVNTTIPNYNFGYHYGYYAAGATSYAVYSGALPPAMSLNTTTGMLSGLNTPGGPNTVPASTAYAVGTYTFQIAATNANGSTISNTQTITVSYQPRIMGAPVIGEPLYFEIPGYSGVITSQQWYANFPSNGQGPQPIAGATSTSYTPVTGDLGMFPSIHVVLADGTIANSAEFNALGQIVSQTGQQYGSVATVSLGANNTAGSTQTLYCMSKVFCNAGSHFIESIAAPGTYPGQSKPPFAFGDLSAYANSFGCYLSYSGALGTAATIAPLTPAPSTATRPSTATGTGFFVGTTGRLYDGNGNKFTPRGVNRYVYGVINGVPPVAINSGASICRIFTPYNTPFSQYNYNFVTQAIANKIAIMPCIAGYSCSFVGTISGNILTVTQMNYGNISSGTLSLTGTGVSKFSILPFGTGGTTGTGKVGTYQITVSQTVSTSTTISGGGGSTGNGDPNVLLAIAQTWADEFSDWAPYQKYMILNIANEWGPGASATNTVWRDTYIQAIAIIRAAGYTCPLAIDSPASGQDLYALQNHTAAVFAADSKEKNILFSPHLYGLSWKPGNLPPIFNNLQALRVANPGMGFIVGELGAQGQVGNGSWGWADVQEAMAHCEAYEIGWVPWATDDPGTNAADYNFALSYNGSKASGFGSYATSDPNDLTPRGKQVILSQPYGLSVLAANNKSPLNW